MLIWLTAPATSAAGTEEKIQNSDYTVGPSKSHLASWSDAEPRATAVSLLWRVVPTQGGPSAPPGEGTGDRSSDQVHLALSSSP